MKQCESMNSIELSIFYDIFFPSAKDSNRINALSKKDATYQQQIHSGCSLYETYPRFAATLYGYKDE
jgi:hypothetical protein